MSMSVHLCLKFRHVQMISPRLCNCSPSDWSVLESDCSCCHGRWYLLSFSVRRVSNFYCHYSGTYVLFFWSSLVPLSPVFGRCRKNGYEFKNANVYGKWFRWNILLAEVVYPINSMTLFSILFWRVFTLNVVRIGNRRRTSAWETQTHVEDRSELPLRNN